MAYLCICIPFNCAVQHTLEEVLRYDILPFL